MRLLWKTYQKDNLDLNIDECGIHQFTITNKYSYTVTQEYVLHSVLDGIGYVEYEGITYTVTKGQFFLIKKGMKISYYADSIDPWKYCWIGFSGNLTTKYLKKNFNAIPCVFSFQNNDKLSNIILSFTTQIYENPNVDTELFRLKNIHRIFFEICHQFNITDQANDEISINDHFKSALTYINGHFSEGINICDVCERLNISRSYLYRLFIQNMDISPQNYLIQIRLYHASQLLLTTQKTIKEIAFSTGYDDQLQFSSQFKKKYQLSPKYYRKLHATTNL